MTVRADREGLEPGSIVAGWYEDPEAPDLERWWTGSAWSDTEFRPKPEDSELIAYVKSYRDLGPTSPTNYLAVSALVQATICLAVSALCLAIAVALPAAMSMLVGATFLIVTEGVVVLVGLWSVGLGIITVRNARRNQDRRLQHAIGASVIAATAVMVAVALLIAQAPAWWANSGLAG
ncbi:DUF2510 domain-containing protein [Agromyces sp. ZXT2-3]|uniref:DUF2510 domain-containing protein n=1 Tax=Agromyces sp. ZXT2-3 TaxID=3461152 RepID=UPI004054A1E1